MPAQTRAFHAGREFAHTRQRCELAEFRRIDVGVLLRQQCMHVVEQRFHFGAGLAFHGFGEQRGRRHGDRAAAAVELHFPDAIAIEIDVQRQPVAAKRIVTVRMRIGRLEPAEVTRVAVVIDDDVAIEIFQIHRSFQGLSPVPCGVCSSAAISAVDFLERVVEGHGRTRGGGYLEEVHHRHGAMMAGADGDAFGVENRADVVRMDAVHDERDHSRLVWRSADDPQARNFLQPARRVHQQLVLVRSDAFDADWLRDSERPRRGRWRR